MGHFWYHEAISGIMGQDYDLHTTTGTAFGIVAAFRGAVKPLRWDRPWVQSCVSDLSVSAAVFVMMEEVWLI